MLSIVAPSHTDPSGYQIIELPKPVVSEPTDVVIQVYGASVNPIDVKKAAGALKMALKDQFPYKIGYDCAGRVTDIGSEVKRLKVGDEVYARLPDASRGTWSQYAKCAEEFVALKPKALSFGDAASLPLAATISLQALRMYKGSLSGKTVLIPAGLSGTGSYAAQLAKRVFNAGKVITTVSTSKIDKVPEYLGEGVIDQIIDYTKEDIKTAIPPGSVDFMLDTTGQAMQFLSLMVPSTSLIVSISTLPSGTQLQESSVMRRADKPQIPRIILLSLNAADAFRRLRAWRWGVKYQYLFLEPNAQDLEALSEYVAAGKLVPVVGTRVPLTEIEKVREACGMVYHGKGGIGKVVIEVDWSK